MREERGRREGKTYAEKKKKKRKEGRENIDEKKRGRMKIYRKEGKKREEIKEKDR